MTDKEMEQITAAARMAAEARGTAIPDTVVAVRALEKALITALEGEPLRGLRNICEADLPIYGARLRGDPDRRIPPWGGSGSVSRFIIITPDGSLSTLAWLDSGDIEQTPTTNSELRVGDAEHMAKTLREILPRHVRASRQTTGRYRRASRLAARIRAALEGEE